MALYRVEITAGDGERETVTVEADNIRDARAKARAGAETGSTIGLPVLEVAPTRAARPTVGAGDVGEEQGGAGRAFSYVPPTPTTVGPVESYIDPTEWGDAIPSITAPPRTTTFRDFTQSIDPDLIDPRSSSYVPPPVTTAPPMVGTTGFADENIVPNIVPPAVAGFADAGSFAANVAPTRPVFVPPAAGGGFAGDDNFAANIVPTPRTVAPPAAVNGAGNGVVNGAGTGFADDDSFAADVGPVVGAGGNGEIDPATGIPILTSREMIDDQVLRRAGMRRALQNVFGQQLGSGVGPLAGYLERQAYPLSDAMTAGAYADMARAFAQDRDLATLGGTAAGPQQFDYGVTSPSPTVDQLAQQFVDGTTADFGTQRMEAMLADPEDTSAAAAASGTAAGGLPAGYSFENFLRTTRDQPTGLGGAYGQALQDVSYLRGLGSDALPPVLQAAFNPGSAEATADVANLLGAAQRGRYSGLVSSRFRQPTQQDLFADYFLSRQDAAKAGQTPQNFLNFAASRFGL